MKNKSFLVIVFFSSLLANAQGQILQYQGRIYEIGDVDANPEFPNGIDAFYKFLAKNFKVPEEDGIDGKIITTFVIETDGTISDIKVLQDVGFGTKEEVIRVLKKTDKWVPAKIGGVPVRVRYKFPMTIKTAG